MVPGISQVLTAVSVSPGVEYSEANTINRGTGLHWYVLIEQKHLKQLDTAVDHVRQRSVVSYFRQNGTGVLGQAAYSGVGYSGYWPMLCIPPFYTVNTTVPIHTLPGKAFGIWGG